MTPIHLAAKYGHVEILESLKDVALWRLTSKKVKQRLVLCGILEWKKYSPPC